MKCGVYFDIKNRWVSLSQGSKILLSLNYIHINIVKWVTTWEDEKKELMREFENADLHSLERL